MNRLTRALAALLAAACLAAASAAFTAEAGPFADVPAVHGSAAVVDLPKIGITGNSRFMFQELNNAVIADHIEAWMQANVK